MKDEELMGGMIGYIVGSDHGRGASEADLRECQHHIKLLAQALGELLVATGQITNVPMTGPELIAHAGTLAQALGNGELILRPSLDGLEITQFGDTE